MCEFKYHWFLWAVLWCWVLGVGFLLMRCGVLLWCGDSLLVVSFRVFGGHVWRPKCEYELFIIKNNIKYNTQQVGDIEGSLSIKC